jgi:hypothetical protein
METMATDIDPADAGAGVSDVLLGKHHRDHSDADITDGQERKKRNKKRKITSTILDRDKKCSFATSCSSLVPKR